MDGFEIQTIPGKGRSMIAIKSFKTDDVIFEEEPFVSCQFSWNKTYKYLACDHCMRPLETAEDNVKRLTNDTTINLPYPEYCPTKQWKEQFTQCENCSVKYCSKECKIEAFKKYHGISCMGVYYDDLTHPINVLNEKWKLMHFPPETGTIMLLVRLLAMYSQSKNKDDFLNTLKSFQSIMINEELNILHKILGSNFENHLNELHQAFCNAFPSNEFSIFTSMDNFKSLMALIGTNSQGIATSSFAEWVRKVTEIDLPPNEKYQLDTYIDELYRKINSFAGDFLNNEGSGLYVLESKINHSCVPNAICTFPYSNDILVLKAINDIQIGEEICISYLDDCHLERSRHSRQKELRENYIFICECTKCENQKNDPDVTSDEEDIDDDDDDDNNEFENAQEYNDVDMNDE